MRPFYTPLLILPLILSTQACGDDKGGDTTDTADNDVDADTLTDATTPTDTFEAVEFEIEPPDTGTPETDRPDGDQFGEPCLGNTDCETGWCVEGAEGYICTEECLEECDPGYDCRSVQGKGDVVFLCLPRVLKLCTSCLEDFQCNGGACLMIDGSHQCAALCDDNDGCPSGYTCLADATGEKEGKYCQPVSGTCSCSPPFEGVTQLCTRENALGTCLGTETCDPLVGWVDCTANDPVDESCNYLDDNCDGSVDEDFKVDNVYATPETCGSCGTACDDVLANAAVTECVVTDGTPRCQVVRCDNGYTAINQFVCAPESSSLCQPCITAAECLGTEAACTTLDDGDFCTLPCGDDGDCTVGFACASTENGMQCVPEFGSCTCDGSNLDLARSCTKIFTPPDPAQPVVTCKGFEACTPSGWGGCDLPDDDCDGIDNDCDGVIDGPHKTGDKYTAIEHCGACGISCLGFARDNAVPVCDAAGAVPVCSYTCAGTAVDVNGRSDDGCECIPTPGSDLAGDDVDSNCDGVDGEVNNAIFVSKDGDDANDGSRASPVLTLQSGLTKARNLNKRDVYVATGVYSQNIILEDGVGIFGGYSPDFAQHDVLLYETAIIGVTPDAQHIGTVTAISVGATGSSRETVIDGFTIFGIAAGNIVGGNSYGVYVRNSGDRLRISKNRIFGGPGGNGANGARGADGDDGVDGSPGTAAKNLAVDCQGSNATNGGAGGVRTCDDGTNVSGGAGGTAACPVFGQLPPNSAKGGLGFGPNSGLGGSYGQPYLICATPDNGANEGCDPYPFGCTTCIRPTAQATAEGGDNGTNGADGTAGTAGAATGTAATGDWVGASGGDGGDGTNGSGGGGGGAGAGVQVEGTSCTSEQDDNVGGSGGGGGSGGCLATGGDGGKPGGGSFAIFIVGMSGNHTPQLVGNTLQSGRGGSGGAGGAGGVGGAAGEGGVGGIPGDQLPTGVERDQTQCATSGGNGGNGGAGGDGGGGGGGAGGPSYGLFVSLPSTPPAGWKTGNTFSAGGQGGNGGNGGVSVDASRTGQPGAAGTAANTNY